MRDLLPLPLLIALLACGQGSEGPAGRDGSQGTDAAQCTATEEAGRWTIQCPDGSGAELDTSPCTIEAGDQGEQLLRCPDGSEARILPGDLQRKGEIAGVAHLEGGRSSEGILVELLGTAQTARTLADGSYLFEGVPPGTYVLRFSLEPYLPLTVGGVHSFGGRFEVEGVELSLGRDLPSQTWDRMVVAEASLLIYFDYEIIEFHELAKDEVHRLKPPRGSWYRLEHTSSGSLFAAVEPYFVAGPIASWSPDEGFHFYDDRYLLGLKGDGAFARSDPQEEGVPLTYHFLRGGQDWQLELEDVDHVEPVRDRTQWFLSAGGETLLLDGEGSEPSITTLSTEPFLPYEWSRYDPTGEIVVLTFEDGLRIFDLGRKREVEVEGGIWDVIASPARGVVWRNAARDASFFYDGNSGTTRELTDPRSLAWSPAAAWYWHSGDVEQDQPPSLTSRDGTIVYELAAGAWPEAYAPGEERVVVGSAMDDGFLLDLHSGEERELGTNACDWLDDRRLVCEPLPGELHLIGLDGGDEILEEVTDWWIDQGLLIYEQRHRHRVHTPAGADHEIGSATTIDVLSGGERLLWKVWTEEIFLMDLASGSATRLLQGVGDYQPLRDGLLYSVRTRWGDTLQRWAPFPEGP